MNQKARMKLLILVIACCALLMGSQIVADMIFTVVIIGKMDVEGLPAEKVEELLAEQLAQNSSGVRLLAYLFTFFG